jgi:Na+/H+ antiporter NhaD/arsenite permease-like protein
VVWLAINGTPVAAPEGEAGGHSPARDEPAGRAESQPDGTFVLPVPDELVGTIESASIQVSRSHFTLGEWEVGEGLIDSLNQGESVRLPDWELERELTAGFWVATLTFVAMLIFIALEILHSTMAALFGVAVVLGTSLVGGAIYPGLYIFDFHQALSYIHFDVIFLIMGMMIVIGVIEETGIFQWLAYQSYRFSRGRPWLLVVILMVITSVASALLDNVTTMLLMTPITIQIAIALGLNPLVLLMPEVLASNVGGITTLIGTPTNILIGSYAGLSFNDFFTNLTPGVIVALAALMGYVLFRYRKQLLVSDGGLSQALLDRLEEGGRITQPVKLRKAGIVFGVMLVLFVIGEAIHLSPAVTAIVGAVAVLLWVEADIEEMLNVVDWTTLMFFISLFIVVGAITEVGLISMIADAIGALVSGNLTVAILVLAWSAAILSGIIDNVPFTAAMLPVVGYLSRTVPGASNLVLFYALSIGSAMGGNTSLIGSSANLVTAGVAKEAGYELGYIKFLKIGLPAMFITVAIGILWLLIRF